MEEMTQTFDKALAESLCDLEIPATISFSPNGQKLLYATNLTDDHCKGKNPVSTLWLASTARAGSSRQLTSGLFEDQYPRWHPDGHQIAFISDRAKPGESSAIWTLTLGEDGGGEPYPITPSDNVQRIERFAFSPNGEEVVFISPDEKPAELKEKEEKNETDAEVWGERWEYARLRIVHVNSKQSRTLVGGERHVTNASWSPDGKKIAFQSDKTPQMEEPLLTGTTISVVDVEDGKVTDLCTIHNDLANLTWAPDGKIYFITGTPIDKTFAGSAVYNIDPNAESPTYAKVAYGVDDDAGQLRLSSGELVVSCQHRLDTWISRLGKEVLFKKDTDIETWDVFFDADGGSPVVAAGISDINNPFEVFIIKGDELIQLSNHGHIFKDREFGSCTVLSCQSSDGEVELDGLYLTPTAAIGQQGEPKTPLPTFVMIHGGPTDRNCNTFNSHYYMWAPYILSKGYGVLLPQYRGSNGRGERFASYSVGGIGIYDYADVVTITDNAITRGFANRTNLLVGGYSQGGFLAYLSAVRNGLHGLGWRFNAAIAGAGVCDIDSLPLTSDSASTYDRELNGGRIVWNMDRDDIGNRKASALWEVAGAVREARERGCSVIPPMLILHGEADVRCPFSQAEGFSRALRAYDLPCEFVRYPRQEHSIKEQKFWIDMLERIGRWCDVYIGPASSEAK
ncbi:putative peptidase YuxL-like protein [Cladobotryum mycophilum]|uniref:Dipeptidyl-peptidase V n=1 Tax=Cladobotryum mycophilum TaxID=491253 RepID=A0ABR0SQ23_9HYPO